MRYWSTAKKWGATLSFTYGFLWWQSFRPRESTIHKHLNSDQLTNGAQHPGLRRCHGYHVPDGSTYSTRTEIQLEDWRDWLRWLAGLEFYVSAAQWSSADIDWIMNAFEYPCLCAQMDARTLDGIGGKMSAFNMMAWWETLENRAQRAWKRRARV